MWDESGVGQRRPAPYRTPPANTSFRPTLPDRCSKIPGICNSLEHGDFGVLFHRFRDS